MAKKKTFGNPYPAQILQNRLHLRLPGRPRRKAFDSVSTGSQASVSSSPSLSSQLPSSLPTSDIYERMPPPSSVPSRSLDSCDVQSSDCVLDSPLNHRPVRAIAPKPTNTGDTGLRGGSRLEGGVDFTPQAVPSTRTPGLDIKETLLRAARTSTDGYMTQELDTLTLHEFFDAQVSASDTLPQIALTDNSLMTGSVLTLVYTRESRSGGLMDPGCIQQIFAEDGSS